MITGESRFRPHFERQGYQDIFAIDFVFTEESSGYQTEHERETVVARKADEYYRVVGHQTRRVFGRSSFAIESEKRITKQEYEAALASKEPTPDDSA